MLCPPTRLVSPWSFLPPGLGIPSISPGGVPLHLSSAPCTSSWPHLHLAWALRHSTRVVTSLVFSVFPPPLLDRLPPPLFGTTFLWYSANPPLGLGTPCTSCRHPSPLLCTPSSSPRSFVSASPRYPATSVRYPPSFLGTMQALHFASFRYSLYLSYFPPHLIGTISHFLASFQAPHLSSALHHPPLLVTLHLSSTFSFTFYRYPSNPLGYFSSPPERDLLIDDLKV